MRTFRRELQALGHDVVVVAPAYPQSGMADEPATIRLASRGVPLDPEDRLMQGRALRAVADQPQLLGIDLVHIQTPFAAHYAGLKIARRFGVPCVATYHTFFEEYLYHYVPFAPRALMRALARGFSRRQGSQVDALIVPSRAMLSALTAYGVRAPMTILPTGIRMEELSSGDGAAFRAAHGIAAERPVLVHIGRVAFEKNIDFLMRMFLRVRARFPDALLLVAGEGPALPHLKNLARSLLIDDGVKFVGNLDRATVLLDCYRAGDVFVFASRTETQGLVLLEAMALGVPVVSLAEMGTIDILEAGKGALIANNDEADFSAKVCQLLGSAALRQQLSADGRQYAEQWDAAKQAQRLAQFYADVVARRKSLEISATDTNDGIDRRGLRQT